MAECHILTTDTVYCDVVCVVIRHEFAAYVSSHRGHQLNKVKHVTVQLDSPLWCWRHTGGRRAGRPPGPQRTRWWHNECKWTGAHRPPARTGLHRWCGSSGWYLQIERMKVCFFIMDEKKRCNHNPTYSVDWPNESDCIEKYHKLRLKCKCNVQTIQLESVILF